MKALKIAIAGLGTVGCGVIELLNQNRDLISKRAGRDIEITAVSARSKNKDRGFDISPYRWEDRPADLANLDVDVVVELMGGHEGEAYQLVRKSLEAGKSVVTANKALLAHHGIELARISKANAAPLLFEAAIAGGIPIVKTIREGLAANRIEKLYGILNGTCNYILTTMEDTGRDFSDVLKEAQEKGYAEADPTLDVDGGDTAHKLCLLSALAFGIAPDLSQLNVQGIRSITALDIQSAGELGYRIKLLGKAERVDDGRVLQIVEPCLVRKDFSLANVHGVLNAVYTFGNHVGPAFIEGRGAGGGPTASAVVADIIDLARGNTVQVFGIDSSEMGMSRSIGPEAKAGEYFIRLMVLDQPGVLADISSFLRDHKISIESLIQRGRDPGQPVAIIMTTHIARRGDIDQALDKVAELDSVTSPPLILQILAA